eukprot:TRINITY_DN1362_c0_g1_i1.p2 TRINITY_DN1362_c0_g1~~TRINITY_DN1362_c0_g1_i1.p2  ORF type:complete len:200 (+),score=66.84 TRINITY_DN1362_c0_g1_i1:352-951(+)
MHEFLLQFMEPFATEEAWHYDFTYVTKDTAAAVAFLVNHLPAEPKFSILEVGAGVSHVAATFGNRTTALYSISLSDDECNRAHGMGLAHYKCIRHNKHFPIPNSFIPDESLDYVLDVNIGSFSKIWQWNAFLLLRKIKPGGYLITQQFGMDFVWKGLGAAQVTQGMIEGNEKYLHFKTETYPDSGVYMLKKNLPQPKPA